MHLSLKAEKSGPCFLWKKHVSDWQGSNGRFADPGRQGFSLVELLVAIVAAGLLAFVMFPVIAIALGGAGMTAAGQRGKDMYTAIVGADSAHKALSRPSAWPAGFPAFISSTEYFRHLFDEEHFGTSAWEPAVQGFDYSLLSGCGVPECKNRKLAPKNNMWTIINSVGADMDEGFPVLLTRNVAASSLASPSTVTNSQRALYVDNAWDTPFGDKGMILIRKNGAISKARFKHTYANYTHIYKGCQPPVPGAGGETEPTLVYLAPTRVVEPGNETFTAGLAEQAQLKGRPFRLVKRDFEVLKSLFPSVAVFWCAGYLIVFFVLAVRCLLRRKTLLPSVRQAALSCAHFIAVVLYSVATVSYSNPARRCFPVYIFLLAILFQSCSVLLAFRKHRQDHAARVREIKCILSAPLFVGVACLAFIVVVMLGTVI